MTTTRSELRFCLDQSLNQLCVREDLQSLDQTLEIVRRQQYGLSMALVGNDEPVGRIADLFDPFVQLLLELGHGYRLSRHGNLRGNYTGDSPVAFPYRSTVTPCQKAMWSLILAAAGLGSG